MDKARVTTLFIAVVRAGSFSAAAAEAGLTPQAVSKAVRQLEQYLGVRLFHRTTRSLSLTEEGSRLHELAHPGLRLLDDALDQVQSSRQDLEGLIRVAAPTSFGNVKLVPLVRDFQELYPGIRFDLLLDDHYTDLVEARIDVGFRAGSAPERNLVARKLGDVHLFICAAPRYIERHGAPRSLAELAQHRCTGFRHPNTGRMMPWELHVDGGTVYQDLPVVTSFNTVEGELEAVRAGMGIGQLVAYMIEDDLASGALVHLLPQLATSNMAVYLYYPQRTQMPLRVRHFIDFVDANAPGLLAPRRPPSGRAKKK
ncbi:LysR family transcriptional regulator [Oxalobacteraceae bacterium]|nr:LysR family transcriptional regulator [Oxalobacteraceae bacterium]